jgi:NADH:ubiquinone oxidoreductase subunit E
MIGREKKMVLSAERIHVDKKKFINKNGQSLVALLQDVQEQYNYLPEDVLREVAATQNLSLMDIYSVATFYKSFTLHPRGRHQVVTCSGTACHVRGSEMVTHEISRVLGIKPGETTEDGEYSLESVNCLGACALAPLMVVDGEYHGNVTAARAVAVLKEQLKQLQGQTGVDLDTVITEKAEAGCACAKLLDVANSTNI